EAFEGARARRVDLTWPGCAAAAPPIGGEAAARSNRVAGKLPAFLGILLRQTRRLTRRDAEQREETPAETTGLWPRFVNDVKWRLGSAAEASETGGGYYFANARFAGLCAKT